MSKAYYGGSKVALYYGNRRIKAAYLGDTLIYNLYSQATTTVAYHVDTNESHQVTITDTSKILSPTSFTPKKTGYTFIGWRTNSDASADVLTTATSAITVLYAVFRKSITLTYNGNNSTGGSTASETKYQYYNNGNSTDAPTFTVKDNGFTKTDYSFVWWSSSTTQYNPGDTLTLTDSTTLWAQWKAIPFTVPLDSLTWSFTDLYNNGEFSHTQSSDKVYIEIQANGSSQAVGRASATIATRGCNLCRIKYATYFATGGSGLAEINGQSLDNTNAVVKEAYVSVSGSSWELYFDIKDSDTYGANYMYITEILMTHS